MKFELGKGKKATGKRPPTNQMSSQMARTLQLAAAGVIGGAACEVKAEPVIPIAVQVLPASIESQVAIFANQGAPEDARIEACNKLGASKNPAAIKPLVLVMRGTRDGLRVAIDEALVQLKAPEHLAKQLKDQDAQIRKEAAELFGMAGQSCSESQLLPALRDKEAVVREAVSVALAYCGGEDSVGPLIERLQTDADSDVRSAAAQALGEQNASQAKSALEKARTTEKDAFVKVFIKMALQSFESRQAKAS